jgi:amidophosphoribosyltransferase
MCGIIGIVAAQEVAGALYDGLTVLQHRGQDAAGMATADGAHVHVHKGNGLVRDVFDEHAMRLLRGRVGIAHCRYPTAGSEGSDEAQPFYVNSPYGIGLVHNGNLINTEALRQEVFEQDRRNVNTESDSEVLLNVFAHELDTQKALTPEAAFRAVEGVNRRAKGGYAVIMLVLGLGVVAFRARGRIAAMGDADAAFEQAHRVLVEHVAHQAVVLVHAQVGAVGGGDAGRVLAAVLQHRQPVVKLAGHVMVGDDADDSAHLRCSRSRPAALPTRAASLAAIARPAAAPARPAIAASPVPGAAP